MIDWDDVVIKILIVFAIICALMGMILIGWFIGGKIFGLWPVNC